MLAIYRAPNGRTYQYEEGEQPIGFVRVDAPKAAPKRRTTANKRRTAKDKGEGDGS